MTRIPAQRAAHENQRLAGPTAGSRRRRVVAERIVPEQFEVPVLAVIGEHAMGGEALLALTRLPRILNQVKAVEIDAGCDMRGGGPAGVPARQKHRLLPAPFARECRELAMLLQRR